MSKRKRFWMSQFDKDMKSLIENLFPLSKEEIEGEQMDEEDIKILEQRYQLKVPKSYSGIINYLKLNIGEGGLQARMRNYFERLKNTQKRRLSNDDPVPTDNATITIRKTGMMIKKTNGALKRGEVSGKNLLSTLLPISPEEMHQVFLSPEELEILKKRYLSFATISYADIKKLFKLDMNPDAISHRVKLARGKLQDIQKLRLERQSLEKPSCQVPIVGYHGPIVWKNNVWEKEKTAEPIAEPAAKPSGREEGHTSLRLNYEKILVDEIHTLGAKIAAIMGSLRIFGLSLESPDLKNKFIETYTKKMRSVLEQSIQDLPC